MPTLFGICTHHVSAELAEIRRPQPPWPWFIAECTVLAGGCCVACSMIDVRCYTCSFFDLSDFDLCFMYRTGRLSLR